MPFTRALLASMLAISGLGCTSSNGSSDAGSIADAGGRLDGSTSGADAGGRAAQDGGSANLHGGGADAGGMDSGANHGGADAGGMDGGAGDASSRRAGDAGAAPRFDAGLGSDGDGAVTDSGVCEVLTVSSSRMTPDMLILLDRSGSMEATRWAPSVSAIKSVTAKLDSSINFGLMVFPGSTIPSPPLDCAADAQSQLTCSLGFSGGATCETGSLLEPIAPMNASKISSALDQVAPSGGTPTAASLQAAHQLFGGLMPSPEAVPPMYVLLITDGQPNCTNGSVSGSGTDTQAVTDTVNEIKSLAADGIKTYVVGYNTNQDPAKTSMDMMAAAGGTGATTHIEVENSQDLQNALQDVVGKAASCTFALDPKPADPSYVSVQVNGKDIYLNQPNGWTMGADSKTVEVQGTSCSTLRANATSTVVVTVQCQKVVPL